MVILYLYAQDQDQEDSECSVQTVLLSLSKLGGLAVSAIWVLIDLFLLINSAPGQGSLILGSIAVAISLINLVVEFSFWLTNQIKNGCK